MYFRYMLKPIIKIFLMAVLFSISIQVSWAQVRGIPQLDYDYDQKPAACITEGQEQVDGPKGPLLIPGNCSYNMSGYVPSGYYSLYVMDGVTHSFRSLYSNSVYIDSTTNLGATDIVFSISSAKWLRTDAWYSLCIAMIKDGDSSKGVPVVSTAGYGNCGGRLPSPSPTPPVPDTSCTINNSNALSVSLGTLNRDEIPTVPDSGSAISKTISVVCTGGALTAKMQLNYTPVSIGSGQAVKSSANGVGAAIFYNNKLLAPTDVTAVNFLEGSNTLTLGFQAVRDATVALKDIPTGAFTASAVLVMTQQ
ncbi:fimbrial protein [Cronobacter dublinensis]|uniref:fimbrial protein n=2 Tax=Cronobacter dublinensis TaxID=413497 RepID=UPI0008FBED41|nr:fimbrial protein [Cronobacter dublinensis]MDI7273086.1 fimbrial protein [Cronobacter dublinensis]